MFIYMYIYFYILLKYYTQKLGCSPSFNPLASNSFLLPKSRTASVLLQAHFAFYQYLLYFDQ